LKINGEVIFKQDRKNVVEGGGAEEAQEAKTDTTPETEQVLSVTDAPYFVFSTSAIPLTIYKVFNLDSYFNAQTFFSLFQA
jgi:hypothetical protein